jgi:hypothetical protein
MMTKKADAMAQGYIAQGSGKEAKDNPYRAGTREFKEWSLGWWQGSRERQLMDH